MKELRVICILLIAIIVINLIPTNVLATDELTTDELTLSITPSVGVAHFGDEITYTVTMGAVQNLGGIDFKVTIPKGLIFVEGSANTELASTLNTEEKDVKVMSEGKRLQVKNCNYSSNLETTLMTFKCSVNSILNGNKTIVIKDDPPDHDNMKAVDTNSNEIKLTYNESGSNVKIEMYTTLKTQDIANVDDKTIKIINFNSKTVFNSIVKKSESFGFAPALENKYEIKLFDANGNEKASSAMIGSRNVIKILNNNEEVMQYIPIVKGDVTGNGEVKIYDAFKILMDVVSGSETLDEIDLLIRDYNDDGQVKIYDAFKSLIQAMEAPVVLAPFEEDGTIVNEYFGIRMYSSAATDDLPNSVAADALSNSIGIKNAMKLAHDNNIENIKLKTGVYYVDAFSCYIKMQSNISFDLNGSTIKVLPNYSGTYRVFFANDVENIKIYNGNIVGDRIEHNYDVEAETSKNSDAHKEGISTHEYGMGIYLIDVKDANIHDLNIYDMTGVAVYVSDDTKAGKTRTDGITITKNKIHDCRREGIFVCAGMNITITDNEIYDIRTKDGISATKTMTGIDLERNTNEQSITNVLIKNNSIYGTERKWAVCFHYVDHLTIEKNKLGDRITIANKKFESDSTAEQKTIEQILQEYSIIICDNEVIEGVSNEITVTDEQVNTAFSYDDE